MAMTDSQILGPRIRILRSVEIGRHPQVREQLVNKAPETLEALQVAAIDLNRCGEPREPSSEQPYAEVCVAKPAHKGAHWEPYAPEVVSLPHGEPMGLL